ncbi:ArnT family glycosyltransferase [Candidatus Margulisiibacteriota bacterium]
MFNSKLSQQKKIMLAIFCLAIITRIVGPYFEETVFFKRPFLISGPKLFAHFKSDEIIYNFTAKALMEGKGFSLNFDQADQAKQGCLEENYRDHFSKDLIYSVSVPAKGKDGYRAHRVVPPAYPIFLALCYLLFGINTLAYFIPQLIMGSLTCIFIFLTADELFNRKTAMIAGFLVALYPELVFWTHMIRTETLFIFLISLGFFLLIKGAIDNRSKLIYFGAGVISLASLTRITLLLFLPIIILWLYFINRDKKNVLVQVLILLCIFSSLLLPWTLRNYLVFGKFTPLTSEAGIIMIDHIGVKNIDHTIGSFIPQFINYVSNNLYTYLILTAQRFIKYLSPITSVMSTIPKIYKSITWIVIFPLSLIGFVVASVKSWKKVSLMVIFILYYIFLHAAIHVDNGLVYRYPILPFLCIFSAYGYYYLLYERS